MPGGVIPDATVARLPRYLHALVRAADDGALTVSSEELAQASGTTSAQVRKDLSCLGSHGTRGVGYPVAALTAAISSALGLGDDRPVVLVGAGNLGRALATYDGFLRRGFRLAALVDADPAKVGDRVGAHVVRPASQLTSIVADLEVTIGVLTVPDAAAQQVATALVGAGVTAILSFASIYLDVPDHVTVRRVDLSTELQILSFYEQLGSDVSAATG